MAIKWTEAHEREAMRRIYEIAAEVSVDKSDIAEYFASRSYMSTSEVLFRRLLRNNDGSWGLDSARVDREVRRVDRLARGVLVRETTWHVRMLAGNLSCAMTEESARETWRHALTTDGTVVRVTRIRRAP